MQRPPGGAGRRGARGGAGVVALDARDDDVAGIDDERPGKLQRPASFGGGRLPHQHQAQLSRGSAMLREGTLQISYAACDDSSTVQRPLPLSLRCASRCDRFQAWDGIVEVLCQRLQERRDPFRISGRRVCVCVTSACEPARRNGSVFMR